jgi:hypothetical protein
MERYHATENSQFAAILKKKLVQKKPVRSNWVSCVGLKASSALAVVMVKRIFIVSSIEPFCPINVPFGEWEKIPRLQAKTLVCLRCREKLPQDFAFRLRSEISLGLEHQVPQIWKSMDIEIITGHVS